jgi:sporulation protein YlmC with PRC-barrel domain
MTSVVVDPLAQKVTHLVVEPEHRQGLGRLVPLDLVTGDRDQIQLNCTLAEFAQLDSAEDTEFIPGSQGYAAYGPGQVLSWPYYELGGAMGMGTENLDGVSETVTYDAPPPGEVSIRRGDPVHATDGDIGRVQGLVIDSATRRVTHVLLQEGHLWGRKEVAIPMSAVAGTDDGIDLKITKDQVADLPAVDLKHPA